MYVYKRTRDGYTVGFYDPDGAWHPDSDHLSSDDAAWRTAWLNGSGMTAQELADVCEHLRQIRGRPLEINSQQEFV